MHVPGKAQSSKILRHMRAPSVLRSQPPPSPLLTRARTHMHAHAGTAHPTLLIRIRSLLRTLPGPQVRAGGEGSSFAAQLAELAFGRRRSSPAIVCAQSLFSLYVSYPVSVPGRRVRGRATICGAPPMAIIGCIE